MYGSSHLLRSAEVVQASCSATAGANDVTLQVQDTGGLTATANLIVNVAGNTPPTLGDYSNTSVAPGGSTTITPTTGPADNGTVSLVASASAGFTGTVSANSDTGVVSIGNANPSAYTITVTATDNCDSTTIRSFSLAVETMVPTGLIAAAMSGTTIAVAWNSVNGAHHYELIRDSGSGFSTIALPVTNNHIDSVSANTAHVYRVRAIASTGQMSAFGNVDLATATLFTDDPLVVGSTIVRAGHLSDIRNAVNAVRAAAGLPAAIYVDTNPAGLPIKAAHINELRAALDPARSALGLLAVTYANGPLNVLPVRALDFTELRNAVK